jgi:hypothetical protein
MEKELAVDVSQVKEWLETLVKQRPTMMWLLGSFTVFQQMTGTKLEIVVRLSEDKKKFLFHLRTLSA